MFALNCLRNVWDAFRLKKMEISCFLTPSLEEFLMSLVTKAQLNLNTGNQILLQISFISNSARIFSKISWKNTNVHEKDSIFSLKISQKIQIFWKNPNFHVNDSIFSSKFPRKYTFEWKTVAIRARPSKHKILHRKQPLKRL